MSIAGVVLTLNEERNISDCLDSIAWTDRRVVFDSFSTDATVDLSLSAGAEVLQHPFENYAQQRNAAIDRVEADWILFVDADERATSAVEQEVRLVTVTRPEIGWSLPRHNYIFGRLTKGCGWYPDYQFRLFRRGFARWERPVHELAVVDGPQGRLENPLVHLNYADLTDFTERQRRYSDMDAKILFEQGQRPRAHAPLSQAWRQFWWRYVELHGTGEGWHGLRLSALMAYYEARKYRTLARLWRTEAGRG